MDIAHDHNLSQTVLHPTRLHNILDLFLTNYPALIQSTQVIPGLSDHDIVIIESKIKPLFLKQTIRKIPLYDKADWQSIVDGLQLLKYCICRTPDENIDVEHLWNQSHDCMQNLVYTHIPHKTARRHCNLPWMTTKLRRQIRTRNRLYQKAKLSGSKDIFNRFVTLKHSIQKDLWASYWRYISNLISPEDEGSQQQSQRRFWSYIKSLKHDHNNITALSTTDGIVTDNLQKANALNLQFKSVFTEERY